MTLSEAPFETVLTATERLGDEVRTQYLTRRHGDALANLTATVRLGLHQGYPWR